MGRSKATAQLILLTQLAESDLPLVLLLLASQMATFGPYSTSAVATGPGRDFGPGADKDLAPGNDPESGPDKDIGPGPDKDLGQTNSMTLGLGLTKTLASRRPWAWAAGPWA